MRRKFFIVMLLSSWLLSASYLFSQEQADEVISLESLPMQPLELMPEQSALHGILNALFNTYMQGWFEHDIDKVLTTTAPMLLLPLYPQGLSRLEQEEFFLEFFSTYPHLRTLNFADIYQLESVHIVQFDPSKAVLIIQSQAYPPHALREWDYWRNFWNAHHHFFFQKMANNQWRLLAFDMDETDSHHFFATQRE